MANIVEATLVSRYDDRVTKVIEQQRARLDREFKAMAAASAGLRAQASAAFAGLQARATNFFNSLRSGVSRGIGYLKSFGSNALLMTLGVGAGLTGLAFLFRQFFADRIRESSALLDIRSSFDSLSQSMRGQQLTLQDLRRATDRQVDDISLLREANRVLNAQLPLTSENYQQLTRNIFFMAKAAGIDGVRAQKLLGDAVISGRGEVLKQIGVNDRAITAIVANSGAVDDAAKKQVFYEALLKQTSAALAQIPQDLNSVDDALLVVQNTITSWANDIFLAAQRSGVLQALLGRLTTAANDFGQTDEELDRVTLSANRFFIAALRGFGEVSNGLAYFADIFGLTVAFIQRSWAAITTVIGTMVAITLHLIATIVDAFALLPGAAGRAFESLSAQLRQWGNEALATAVEMQKAGKAAWEGTGQAGEALRVAAGEAFKLAKESEKYVDVIRRGAAAQTGFNSATATGAVNQKELNKQLEAYRDIQRELQLRAATPEQALQLGLDRDLERIAGLKGVSATQRNDLVILATEAFNAKMRELEKRRTDDLQKAADEQRRIVENFAQVIAASPTVNPGLSLDQILGTNAEREARRLAAASAASNADIFAQGARSGNESAQLAALNQIPAAIDAISARMSELNSQQFLTPEQLGELVMLQGKFDELNALSLTPLEAEMQRLLASFGQFTIRLAEFGAKSLDIWGAFWADMVSQQENAFGKMIAAFINLIAEEIKLEAKRLFVQSVIAFAHLDFASGARFLAGAAALTAIAGAISGAASAIANTNQAGAGGSFQQNAPRPTASTRQQVQPIDVGAPGRAQNPGEARIVRLPPMQVHLQVSAESGLVVKHVVQGIKDNNQGLRVAIRKA